MRYLRRSAISFLSAALVAAAVSAQESGIHMEVLLQSGQSWNGARLPAYPEGAPEISIVRITIPPETALPVHRHPFINGGVLLSGTLTVRTEDGQETHLKEGDALLEVVNTWHAGHNEGTEPAVALIFYVGTPEIPISELKATKPGHENADHP